MTPVAQLVAVAAQEGSSTSSWGFLEGPADSRAVNSRQSQETLKDPEAGNLDGVWGYVGGQMRLESGVREGGQSRWRRQEPAAHLERGGAEQGASWPGSMNTRPGTRSSEPVARRL